MKRIIVVGLLVAGAPWCPAMDPTSDAKRLQEQLGGNDTDRLFAYLKGQILTNARRAQIGELIRQLGDRSYRVRQEASRKLTDLGPVALGPLREAFSDPDPEIVGRAKKAVDDIRAGTRFDLPVVVVRQLIRQRHEKAVEGLLDYYPSAIEESHAAAVRDGLAVIAVSGKDVHPAIVRALNDPTAERRELAVRIVVRSDDRTVRRQIKGCLKDADVRVRFHAARGLLEHDDRDAVPVLIAVVAEGPVTLWQQAEELLYDLAGNQAPKAVVGTGNSEGRKKGMEVWAEWWKEKGNQILLGRKEARAVEVAVICDVTEGRVWEWRGDGTESWGFGDINGPVDAHALSGNRCLIAEQRSNRITERATTGEILWEKTIEDGPVSCSRMPNGNTFVATNGYVAEYRRDGSEVYRFLAAEGCSIADAMKLPDGRVACSGSEGTVVILGVNGREENRFNLEHWGGVEVTDSGTLLLPRVQSGKIIETNPSGKTIWETTVPGAWYATRLPDGSTLVAIKNKKRLVKVGADGKVQWEKDMPGAPHAIHWR